VRCAPNELNVMLPGFKVLTVAGTMNSRHVTLCLLVIMMWCMAHALTFVVVIGGTGVVVMGVTAR